MVETGKMYSVGADLRHTGGGLVPIMPRVQ
jgi:hypothetical protein